MNTDTVGERCTMILPEKVGRSKNAILLVIQTFCQLKVISNQVIGLEGVKVTSRDC